MSLPWRRHAPAPAPSPVGGGALRAVLAEIRAARGGGVSLTEVAQRVGVSREEAEAMVEYWVQRGALATTDLGRGCASGGCGGCPSAARDGGPGCGTDGPSGPVLVAITVRPRS
ncbi:FeoC-like transcriptional regulator [Streptomyces sp. RY43-2]|uniref:FeoC-like transcriptional regulator n=1 Tax=Streptomyces macrolidinus TaxID=2952607 RepID=A0ABT0ZJN5_9ACTN|nr:FeoC-like transcriptional regulator [Streptomyces macrolidinus]MCN9243808.1 FeoC-like transcriptional regulator [Streptomyces macrolidinus]